MENKQQLTMDELGRLKLIAGVELFATLLDDDLLYVASRTEFRSVPEGTVLFSEGEIARQFYIVQSGSVSVISGAAGANPVELARYMSGDVFGDFHFVINSPYDATARTLEKTDLLVFPGNGFTFDRLSNEKPDTASRILLRSITMISARIRSTNHLISENTPWIRELRKQIYTDPPTGLWNKAFMDSEIPQNLSGTVAVLMIKPDRFKEINDTLGHAAGDVILANLASFLIEQAKLSPGGWAVRLRSNEMALILPDCDRLAIQTLAESIHSAIPGLLPSVPDREPFVFSASMALGFWPDDDKNWHNMTEKTNQIMQDLWKTGGNRIVLLREAGQ